MGSKSANKKWSLKNPTYWGDYFKKNKQTITERKRPWTARYQKTPKYIFSLLKRSSKKRKMEMPLSQEEFLDWYFKSIKKCLYCGVSEEKIINKRKLLGLKFNRLTIDRIENNLPYRLGNIALCCEMCNKIKNSFLSADDAVKIGTLVISKKWEEI